MIIFLYSIVHTGTIFTEHLLASHPAIHFGTNLNGTTARPPLNALLDALMEERISVEQFETLIKVASVDRDLMVAGLDDPLSIPTDEAPDWPHTVLGCHIFPKGYQGKTWPRDLFEAGFEFPIVTPLRRPVATFISLLLRAGDSTEFGLTMGWAKIQDYLIRAYAYLPHLQEQEQTFFLPLDEMRRWPSEEKKSFILSLFHQLTRDEALPEDTLRFVEEWPRVNVTTPEKYGEFEDPETISQLLRVKARLSQGQDPRGVLEIVDKYVERLRRDDELIELLQLYEYDLPWLE